MDRSIVLRLNAIPKENRKTEQELKSEFEANHPYILGCLCDAISEALKKIDDTNPKELPRMADSFRWMLASEKSWNPEGDFQHIFWEFHNKKESEALENDDLALFLIDSMQDKNSHLISYEDICKHLNINSHKLGHWLKRIEILLKEQTGIVFKSEKKTKNKGKRNLILNKLNGSNGSNGTNILNNPESLKKNVNHSENSNGLNGFRMVLKKEQQDIEIIKEKSSINQLNQLNHLKIAEHSNISQECRENKRVCKVF